MIPKHLWLAMVKGKAVFEYKYNVSEFGFEKGSADWICEMNKYPIGSDEWLTYTETILELKAIAKGE